MSIRLKDTIYDIINNSDKLDGYHRNNLYTSIPAWITATELSKGITVEGDSDKFYPVVISVSSSKEMPTFISIQKDLGTKTPSLSGNHSNGTSSLWLRYEMRNTMWDGNGGYIKTWYKYQGYATLVAHARTNTKGHGGLIVWLRGGSCSYTISCTNSFTTTIYYSSTNIGSTDHPDTVAPITAVDNGGIYTSTTLGYGNISGNASTATKLATARTISLTGSVTGSGSFDGSGNLSIATTTNHTHEYASTVKVGTTSYTSSSNTISIPAYPTVPTSLKCPKSLTIKLNGTSQGAWDGSADKTIDITYSSVGAASSGHNHDSSYAAKSHTHTTIVGSYTSNGGQQNPNYFGTNKVGALMMNTTVNSNTHYKDWLFMDCYSGSDVGGAVAIGVNRQALGAYIMRSAATRTSWAESAELLGTHNWGTYCAAKSHTHNYAGSSSAGGAATSANKLATARTITLSGSVTGSADFDGSAAITITTTTNHTHNYASTVKVGSTSYNSSSNVISLPAYPNSSYLS